MKDEDYIPASILRKLKLADGVDFLFDFGALLICKDKVPFREIRTIVDLKKAYLELTGEALIIPESKD